MRFTNKVPPASTYFPPAGPKNSGHGAPHPVALMEPQHACRWPCMTEACSS